MQPQNTLELPSVRQRLHELKFGNINFMYFIKKLDLDLENISSFDFNSIDIKSKFFELTLNLNSNFFLNEDSLIKEQLKKLSKHSIKFDITLKEINDTGRDRYISFIFGKRVLPKYPLLSERKAPISTDKIRDIVGLRKNLDYYSIEDKPCNNGWQYIFHTADIECFDLSYIDGLLNQSRLLNDYYIKVFSDKFNQLRIVIQRKNSKLFIKDGVPQVNIRHIAAIFRTREDFVLNNVIRHVQPEYIELFIPVNKVFLDSNFMFEEFLKYFGSHYDIQPIKNDEKLAFRFSLKSQDKNLPKDYIIKTILHNVKSNLMTIEQATDIIKSL